MTGKKRGPVPKPKPYAEGFVRGVSVHMEDTSSNRANSCTMDEFFGNIQAFYDININININEHASTDDIRKAAKRAIDGYFKELIHDRKKREEA